MSAKKSKSTKIDDAVSMRFDMRGRLNKISFATNPLLPVFEAIINSIHAIEDGKVASGRITVKIIRNELSLFHNRAKKGKKGKEDLPLITGFEVEDNGIGFTQKNFERVASYL